MRSTGEVMGADRSLPIAFAKAQMAAGVHLPTKGNVFLSVRDGDKEASIAIARDLRSMGFEFTHQRARLRSSRATRSTRSQSTSSAKARVRRCST